jgi:hypothetical protein
MVGVNKDLSAGNRRHCECRKALAPMPVALAWAWFAGGWLTMAVAGAIVGAMLKADELSL